MFRLYKIMNQAYLIIGYKIEKCFFLTGNSIRQMGCRIRQIRNLYEISQLNR